MQLVFLHVLMSLVGAIVLAAVLGLGAAALAPVAWPVALLGLVLGSGAVLSVEGMTGVGLTPIVAAGLAALAIVGSIRLGRLVSEHRGSRDGAVRRAYGARRDVRSGAFVLGTAWIGLAFLLLHAATPLFRADQWTYHLVIAKHVALAGRLVPPIVNDHVIFAGVYEYLLLLPRLFTMDDVVIHGLADAFTAILFAATTTALLRQLAQALRWTVPAGPLIALFVLMASPTYDMVTNAKPDILTIPCVLAVALTLVRREWIAFGFCAMAPMALKPTWAHAGVAAAAALVMALQPGARRERGPLSGALTRVAAGALLGALVALPVWIENVRFFGNPLHPAQIGPFHSTFWSEAMAAHWAQATAKPPGIGGYLQALLDVLWRAPWGAKFILAPTLLALVFGRVRTFTGASPYVAAVAAYVLVWPLLFGANTYARFVYPFAAIALIATLYAFHTLRDKRWLPWLLLVPAVANGSLEVKVMQLAKALPLSVDELYATFPSPMPERNVYEMINEHRRQHHPEAGLRDARILSDNNSAYHYDGQIVRYSAYEFPLLSQERLDVRYLFSWKVPFSQWPTALQSLIATGTPVDPEGRVLYLPR